MTTVMVAASIAVVEVAVDDPADRLLRDSERRGPRPSPRDRLLRNQEFIHRLTRSACAAWCPSGEPAYPYLISNYFRSSSIRTDVRPMPSRRAISDLLTPWRNSFPTTVVLGNLILTSDRAGFTAFWGL